MIIFIILIFFNIRTNVILVEKIWFLKFSFGMCTCNTCDVPFINCLRHKKLDPNNVKTNEHRQRQWQTWYVQWSVTCYHSPDKPTVWAYQMWTCKPHGPIVVIWRWYISRVFLISNLSSLLLHFCFVLKMRLKI